MARSATVEFGGRDQREDIQSAEIPPPENLPRHGRDPRCADLIDFGQGLARAVTE